MIDSSHAIRHTFPKKTGIIFKDYRDGKCGRESFLNYERKQTVNHNWEGMQTQCFHLKGKNFYAQSLQRIEK